jgi:PAS domain S-box-containing protein
MKKNSSVSKGSASVAKAAYILKRPDQWTVEDVSAWLEVQGLGKYRKTFTENAISGRELLSLNEGELMTLRVNASSDRAKFLLATQQLRLNEQADQKVGGEASSDSGSWSAPSDTTARSDSEVTLKLAKPNGELTTVRVRRDVDLSKLRRLIKRATGHRYRLSYTDEDGDVIPIRNDSTLRAALSGAGSSMRITLQSRDKGITAEEGYVLESMLDAVVLADSHGKAIFFNKAAERMFGYRRTEVVGNNVKMLMPPDVAIRHDDIIKRYLATGQGSVVGTGRDVIARRKDGSDLRVRLSLNHSKVGGRDQFCATLTQLEEASEADIVTALNCNMLDSLLNAALVIDETKRVIYSNKQVETLLGFRQVDIVGKNVKALMTGEDAARHDSYVDSYLTTGKAKVIGQPNRRVVGQRKDGSLVPLSLSVQVQVFKDKRYFVGMMSDVPDVDEARSSDKNLLQQQRELVDMLPVPAMVCDETGKIQGFNSGASAMFGYSLIDVVGKNVKMLTPPEIARNHDAYIQNYIKTGKSRVLGVSRDVAGLKKDGSLINFKLTVSDKRDASARVFVAIMQA